MRRGGVGDEHPDERSLYGRLRRVAARIDRQVHPGGPGAAVPSSTPPRPCWHGSRAGLFRPTQFQATTLPRSWFRRTRRPLTPGHHRRPHPRVSGRPVLDPSVPFAVHSTGGRSAGMRAGGQSRPAAGFYPADPDLVGCVVLDFGASTPDMRRTNSTWLIHVTRSTASTSCPRPSGTGRPPARRVIAAHAAVETMLPTPPLPAARRYARRAHPKRHPHLLRPCIAARQRV
jgi:hypothetical protein